MSINNKKNVYYIVSLILTLLVFVAASTFAYFEVVANREKDSTKIYTGTFMINYHQGDVIKGINLVPGTDFGNGAKEPNINTEHNVYKNTFTVSNSGTLDALLDISIDITNNDFTYYVNKEDRNKNILKYTLFTSNGGILSTGDIPASGNLKISSNLKLENNKSENYTLMIWLYDNGTNQNEEQGKTFSGKIIVDATNKLN